MLVLNSASPRRHELLNAAGIAHTVRLSPVTEVQLPGEDPEQLVRRLAAAKARAVAIGPGEVILGADTVVVLDGSIFGKPVDSGDAAQMLRQLSGRDHVVITGICLRTEDQEIVDVARTRVHFRTVSEEDIAEYTRSGEPNDKAGAYAIQGRASRFIAGIEGCYHNVVGLPVSLVCEHLKLLSA